MAKILVVDDDPVFSELMAALLGAYGHHPVLAGSGEAALEMVRAGCRPQLILVDLNMAGMGGQRALSALRGEPNCAGAPLVMLTASMADSAAAQARASGAVGFLSKPVRADVLGGQLARFLDDAGLIWLDDHHSLTRAA